MIELLIFRRRIKKSADYNFADLPKFMTIRLLMLSLLLVNAFKKLHPQSAILSNNSSVLFHSLHLESVEHTCERAYYARCSLGQVMIMAPLIPIVSPNGNCNQDREGVRVMCCAHAIDMSSTIITSFLLLSLSVSKHTLPQLIASFKQQDVFFCVPPSWWQSKLAIQQLHCKLSIQNLRSRTILTMMAQIIYTHYNRVAITFFLQFMSICFIIYSEALVQF